MAADSGQDEFIRTYLTEDIFLKAERLEARCPA